VDASGLFVTASAHDAEASASRVSASVSLVAAPANVDRTAGSLVDACDQLARPSASDAAPGA
jgi:hypothetical protein